jgi:transposase
MQRLKINPVLTQDQLKYRMINAKTSTEFKRWQCLYLIQFLQGISASYLSAILGVSKPSVYLYVRSFNQHGIPGILPKPRGGRKRAFLNPVEETKLIISFERKLLNNKILSFKEMKHRAEKKIGHAISDDYMWDLFHRHGWKKKMIRPDQKKHPGKGKAADSRSLKSCWLPDEISHI